jgi:hypothetical protein
VNPAFVRHMPELKVGITALKKYVKIKKKNPLKILPSFSAFDILFTNYTSHWVLGTTEIIH